jgi:hypothetical protein
VQNAGTVHPGSGLGILSINGTYVQQPGGHLAIEIGGRTAGTTYDGLVVSGAVTLDGALDISLANGFVPSLNDAFTVLTFGSVSGNFTTYNLPTFNGLTFAATQLLNSISLQVVESIGDFNHDNAVNAADYVVWRKTGGSPDDYNTWRANIGQPTGSGSGAGANAAVPEPATVVLLIAGILTFCSRRRSTVL